MTYEWRTHGDEANPIVALIAPSSGEVGREAQLKINRRIELLKDKGFCVKVPVYEDGNLIIESIAGRLQSNRMGSAVSPAVSSEVGASQIIHCIRNGWNMMPLMGGESFEEKIPLIIRHFEIHPKERRRPDVQIFGMSNSTHAAILANRGICSFTSTPFIYFFEEAKSDPHFEQGSRQLEKILKGQEIDDFPRSVICDSANKLGGIDEVFHYPVNSGIIHHETGPKKLLQTLGQVWSFSMEGFLQKPGNVKFQDYASMINCFLELQEENPPAFIEIGNFVTRLDGKNGYKDLFHDETTGQILVSDYNVNKVYANRQKLEQDVVALFNEKTKLESLMNDVSFDGLKPSEQRSIERQLRLTSFMPSEIFQKANLAAALGEEGLEASRFSREDIANILHSQNLVQLEMIREIVEVATHCKVPLIQNTRNGHCANMNIVRGGPIKVRVSGCEVSISKAENHERQFRASEASTLSGRSLSEAAAINTP